jgi:hypothetical protein
MTGGNSKKQEKVLGQGALASGQQKAEGSSSEYWNLNFQINNSFFTKKYIIIFFSCFCRRAETTATRRRMT